MIKNFSTFQKLIRKGYSLDMMYMLMKIKKGIDVYSLCDGEKLLNIYSSLLRRSLISEKGVITLLGDEILNFIEKDDGNIVLPKKEAKIEEFDMWWKAYPGTDSFVYKGITFTGSRGLRMKKDECLIKFNNILQEGEYTSEQLIQCLQYEVKMKKENSYKTKQNKMSYMQNSCTYLHQRTFENFIDMIGQEIKEEEVYDGINI
jgi:hypothetical protein